MLFEKLKEMAMDVIKVDKSFNIKIPSAARKKMGLQEGDKLQIEVLKRGEAVLRAVNAENWAEAVIDKVIRDAPHENTNDVAFDRQFEELQEAIWSRTDRFSETEVERDVAEAIRRVRGKRRGRR